MIKNLLCILLLSLPVKIYANGLTQNVKGTVVDKDSKTPLPYVNIIIQNTDPLKGAITNASGQYKIEKVPLGRYNIQFTYMGYETFLMREVLVTSGKEVVLNVELKESSVQMEEIVIEASENKTQSLNAMSIVSARQLSVEEASRYAGGFDDPSRLASVFAGVASSLQNNGIVVRGNAPKGLLWRLEGVEISNPNHFANITTFGGGGITALSSQMLANSDFFTGAFTAEYGNALSGVFDIKMRTGNEEKREYTIQAGGIGLDFAAEGPFVKGHSASYVFNYRYSTLALLAPVLPEDAGGIRYQDLSFKLNFPNLPIGTLSLWGIGSTDRGRQKAETDTANWKYDQDRECNRNKTYFGALGLTHRIAFGTHSFLNAALSASGNGLAWNVHKYAVPGEPLPGEHIRNDQWKYTLSSVYNYKFSPRWTVQSGFIANRMNYDVLIQSADSIGYPLTTYVNQSGTSHLMQCFAQFRWDITDRWLINGGIHSQYFTLNKNHTVEPRVSLKWYFLPGQSLSVGYGNHSQLEILNIYFARQASASGAITPNRNLDFTRAHHFVFGYDRSLGSNTRLKIETYYQWLYDVPVIKDSSYSLINLQQNWFINDAFVNKGAGRNIGMDITVERFLNNGFYFLFTTSVFQSRYKGGDGVWRNTRYDKRIVANLLAGKEWIVGKNNILGLNGKISYLGGDRISPVDMPLSLSEKDVYYDESDAFSKQKPAIVYMDFTIHYRINRPRYSSVIALQVINALGAKEFYGYRYNYRNHSIDKEQEMTMIPNISYKIEF